MTAASAIPSGQKSKPAPRRKIRVVWWLGIYFIGVVIAVPASHWLFGFRDFALFKRELLYSPLMAVYLPGAVQFFVPDSWRYVLFDHFPAPVVAWNLWGIPYAMFLLNMIGSLSVRRFWTFCSMLVVLFILVVLSAIGETEMLLNFPGPD